MPDLTTNQKIVDQANELARAFYMRKTGLTPRENHRFHLSVFPNEQDCWKDSCIAMCQLLNVDPNEAVRQLEKEKV